MLHVKKNWSPAYHVEGTSIRRFGLLFFGVVCGSHPGGSQCHMVAVTQWERVNEFHFARLAIDAESCQEFTENDLVLLSKEKVYFLTKSQYFFWLSQDFARLSSIRTDGFDELEIWFTWLHLFRFDD